MDPNRPSSRRVRRFEQVYAGVATTVLSTVLVFALLNAVLYLFPAFRATAAVETPMSFFGVDRLLPAYPGWTRTDLIRLHDESRVVFTYEPVVEFRIKPISGRYVNASPVGFRVNAHQAPWPPSRDAENVFVFGGSTTFGWLLADRDTIASHLQDQAVDVGCGRPVAVYNFGQPSYISTQEALFFQALLMGGSAPDVAVFIDGFNDFFFRGEMSYTAGLRAMMDGTDLHQRLGPVLNLPVYQAARRFNALFYRPPVLEPAAEHQLFQRIIAQWLRNKSLIESTGREHGARTMFVWQPVPAYKYDINSHFLYRQEPLEDGAPVPYADIGRAYGLMAERRAELEAGQNFLWLADMQEGKRENFYVDRLHYNATFSGDIASRILGFLKEKRMVGCQGQAAAGPPTGERAGG